MKKSGEIWVLTRARQLDPAGEPTMPYAP